MDDLDLEDFLELTDAQQDAMLDREMRDYQAFLNRMTLRQQVAHHRRSALRTCLNWRRTIARGFCTELFTSHLKQCQLYLLKLRIWRATGVYPGEA